MTGELTGALDALDRCSALAPEDFEAKVARAAVLADLGRAEESAALYAELLAETDRRIAAGPVDALLLIDRSTLLECLGRSDEARQALEEAIRMDRRRHRSPGSVSRGGQCRGHRGTRGRGQGA